MPTAVQDGPPGTVFVRQTHILLFELSPKTKSCSKELRGKSKNSFDKVQAIWIASQILGQMKNVCYVCTLTCCGVNACPCKGVNALMC